MFTHGLNLMATHRSNMVLICVGWLILAIDPRRLKGSPVSPRKSIAKLKVPSLRTLAYLTSPFNNYHTGSEQAHIDICIIAGHLIEAGVMLYCPIAHSYPISIHTGIELHNYELWMPLDKMMLDRCDTLIVAHMLGWQNSRGIKEEIDYFIESKKPIFDLSIKTLCMVRRKDPGNFDGAQLNMGEW